MLLGTRTSRGYATRMARTSFARKILADTHLRWCVRMRACTSERSSTAAYLRFRLRYDAQIRLRRFPALGILFLGVVVAHRASDDYVLAMLPVHWRCHLVFGRELQRVNHAQHLVEVATGGHRI